MGETTVKETSCAVSRSRCRVSGSWVLLRTCGHEGLHQVHGITFYMNSFHSRETKKKVSLKHFRTPAGRARCPSSERGLASVSRQTLRLEAESSE